MSIHTHVRAFALASLVIGIPGPLAGQTPTTEPRVAEALATVSDATFADVWQRVSSSLASELDGATTPEAKKAVYRKMLERFVSDGAFDALRATAEYRKGYLQLVRELPDSAIAQSSNAPLTNPSSNELIERSGATQLLALAGDFRKVFSADESAISLNLNAIALIGGGKKEGRSAQLFYSSHEDWKRLSGTVTFGAKVPEKEITGLSGLPTADELFDALSWDVKVRLIGDRDPLASRWYPLLLGVMGDTVELLARIQGQEVPVADAGLLREAAEELLKVELTKATKQIASSLQVSVKGSGVHLTNVEGKNKYAFTAMIDKGFSSLDLTANASYNVADVSQDGADPFTSKDFQVSAGLTGSVLKDRIVNGRSVELSASLLSKMFVDDAEVPIERKNTFNLNATLAIPFQLKAKIPVSITWTNDPNNLKKEKYVTGQIGLSYDFAAIKDALKLP